MTPTIKPLVLLILDGWGYREDAPDNAIAKANTPVMDRLWEKYPHCLVDGSGGAVGLPDGQMGNSEVGHVNLGAGRIVYQDFTRISKAISDRSFYSNSVLCDALKKPKQLRAQFILWGYSLPAVFTAMKTTLLP